MSRIFFGSPINNPQSQIEGSGQAEEVFGQRGRELNPGVGRGVAKRQVPGVKHLAIRTELIRRDPPPFPPPAVHLVADHRVADMGEMHPDLVRPSRLQIEGQHGHIRQPPEDMVKGPRLAAAPSPNTHSLSVVLPPADGCLDPPRVLPDLPVHQRQVPLFDDPRLELPAEG